MRRRVSLGKRSKPGLHRSHSSLCTAPSPPTPLPFQTFEFVPPCCRDVLAWDDHCSMPLCASLASTSFFCLIHCWRHWTSSGLCDIPSHLPTPLPYTLRAMPATYNNNNNNNENISSSSRQILTVARTMFIPSMPDLVYHH